MHQLNLFWDNHDRIDWMNFRREEEWKGWLIIVKMTSDPQCNRFPFEWTAKRGQGRREEKLAGVTLHQSVDATINQAKETISTYEGDLTR